MGTIIDYLSGLGPTYWVVAGFAGFGLLGNIIADETTSTWPFLEDFVENDFARVMAKMLMGAAMAVFWPFTLVVALVAAVAVGGMYTYRFFSSKKKPTDRYTPFSAR